MHYSFSVVYPLSWVLSNLEIKNSNNICHHIYIYSELVLVEQANSNGYIFVMYCQWTKYNIFLYPCHMLPVDQCELSCKFRLLPADRNYHKGQSRDNSIILLFNSKYKRD